MPNAIIFDGTNLTHRAAHVVCRRDPDAPASAVKGLLNSMIAGWVRRLDVPRSFTVACFDGGGDALGRYEAFPGYKAGRGQRFPQLIEVLESVPALDPSALGGTKIVRVPGYEADDVIATYAAGLTKRGLYTSMITSDADMLQCVSPCVRVGLIKGNIGEAEWYDQERVQREYHFMPWDFATYKALVGDKSDKIPGVTGIGEVTARKLVAKWGNLDAIYQAGQAAIVEVIGQRYADLLLDGYNDAYTALKLTTLCNTVPGIKVREGKGG